MYCILHYSPQLSVINLCTTYGWTRGCRNGRACPVLGVFTRFYCGLPSWAASALSMPSSSAVGVYLPPHRASVFCSNVVIFFVNGIGSQPWLVSQIMSNSGLAFTWQPKQFPPKRLTTSTKPRTGCNPACSQSLSLGPPELWRARHWPARKNPGTGAPASNSFKSFDPGR